MITLFKVITLKEIRTDGVKGLVVVAAEVMEDHSEIDRTDFQNDCRLTC